MILSAQATDVGVNKATARLFPVADNPQAMLALGEDGLREYIKTIGLFNNKAKAVIAMSRALLEEHGGEVPGDRAALEQLPGVGRKTANVVLNSAFGQPTIAVDTHVFRVANRTGLAPGKTPLAVEQLLEARVPEEIRPPCPPLADPARPLHLHRAQAQMPRLRGARAVRVPGQDHLIAPPARTFELPGLARTASLARHRARIPRITWTCGPSMAGLVNEPLTSWPFSPATARPHDQAPGPSFSAALRRTGGVGTRLARIDRAHGRDRVGVLGRLVGR